MQSLNALIDPKLQWDIFSPQAINDAGQIAATAIRHEVQYAVRLDLIRPMLERAPELAADEAAVPLVIDAAEAKAEADAQSHEVVQSVEQ